MACTPKTPTYRNPFESSDSAHFTSHMRKITFVKKILKDGQPCKKCAEVETRLRKTGQLQHINKIAIADERNPDSEGIKLAELHGIKIAPFFIVETESDTLVYTVYLKFAREVLDQTRPLSSGDSANEALDTLRSNPDLDLI